MYKPLSIFGSYNVTATVTDSTFGIDAENHLKGGVVIIFLPKGKESLEEGEYEFQGKKSPPWKSSFAQYYSEYKTSEDYSGILSITKIEHHKQHYFRYFLL